MWCWLWHEHRTLTTKTITTSTWAVMYTVATDSANQKPANQLDALPWCRAQDSHCRWDRPVWLAEVCHVYAAPAVLQSGPIWALGLICSARSASPDILCNVSYMQTHTTPTTNWNGTHNQGILSSYLSGSLYLNKNIKYVQL